MNVLSMCFSFIKDVFSKQLLQKVDLPSGTGD